MSELIERLARLPEDRRAELLTRLRAGARQTSAARPVPRRTAGPAPLSHGQQTLWFLDRLAPGRATYNVGTAYRIGGRLDIPALHRALASVVARHEVLRTGFREEAGEARQFVVPDLVAALPVRDLRGTDEPEAEAERIALALARAPFDLAQAPLWRAELLRLADDEQILLLVVHHAVFDGWSGGVFARELAAYYAVGTGDTAAADRIEPLPVQYGDHAQWQRDRLTGDRHRQLTGFWRDTLAGAPTLELPADRARPAEISYRGACRTAALPSDTAEAVDELARSAGTTPYAVHLSAFLLLLHRYTAQDDLVIGTPVAGRDTVEAENLIGFFVNMLPLRADLSGDPTFRELLDRVAALTRDALSHAELPFDALVEAVRPRRDPSRSPVFQVVFAFQNAGSPLTLPGLDVDERLIDPGTSRFDLSWSVVTAADGNVEVAVEFSTDLFDPETIGQFQSAYRELLAAVTRDPGCRASHAPLMSAEDRDEHLTRWNGPALAVPPLSIPAAFERHARATPDATALVTGDEQLTYGELDARANRLAHLLRERGVTAGGRVVLCLPRTADLVTAVLAVLKAGAAYVPVDPAYPAARMTAILDDAGPDLVVTHGDLAHRLPADSTGTLLLDRSADLLASLPADAPAQGPAPADLAYVLYTSGTTGVPKGVLVEHHSVVGFVEAARELFELTPADRVLGYAAANFDVSVGEMFNALLTGARLHLATDAQRLDVDALQHLIESAGITVTDLPPTVMALLNPERFPALRIVFVGGEAFPGELVNRWNPGRRFFNGYGPTECTVTMVVHECEGHWTSSPPIGLPIAGHVAHVVDRHLEPVPYGVAGELLIGGEGLARGYLGAPGLTEEKFVPDPFGSTPDGRLYRTGDLVRRRRDGGLVFLGRIDKQVKIRGLRIELGDVEAALAAGTGVDQVTVVPWTDPRGDRHLVAYVAPDTVDVPGLRTEVGQRLPRYMTPSYYVTLPALPLTISGKVDHRALPEPEPDRAGEAAHTEPGNDTERTLAEVFAGLLRRERVGVDEDFFELGGNSLQAVALMSRITALFQAAVSLSEFFQAPTVVGLAALVDGSRASAGAEDDLMARIEQMSEAEAARLLQAESGAAR
ncbi:amino acid adenylation domain-containing protein [Streptomyces sp. NPDC050508]|uniref:non-ribosomal peptide synthetase n=1 Tax=Streptomyces sp. NPDC050508 TaxID=3155405 RepID=UPI00344A4BCC